VPYGTGPSFTPFPGISCQATIVKSLRDSKPDNIHQIGSTPNTPLEHEDEHEHEDDYESLTRGLADRQPLTRSTRA
jgi:hypothetical protein